MDDLQVFNPNSMADRILGMGDTINLVKKAQEHIDEDRSSKTRAKNSYQRHLPMKIILKQIQTVKKMGSIQEFIGNVARDGAICLVNGF